MKHIFKNRRHTAVVFNPAPGETGRFKYPKDMPRPGRRPRKSRVKRLQTVWK